MDELTTASESLRVESVTETLSRVILDRPDDLNTFTVQMSEDLVRVIEQLEADSTTRAVVITGEGRAFSAGADVSGGMGEADSVTREGVESSRRGQASFGRLRDSELPIVAAIDGYALGAGMELSMCADLRVASARSEFALPEHNLGLLPGWGGTARLQQLVGESIAKYIVFTGDRFSATQMQDWGFVHEVYDDEEFEDAAMSFAEKVADGPPLAQKYTKRAIHAAAESVDAGLEVEAHAIGHLLDTEDLVAGMEAFHGDDEPDFQGR